MQEVYTHGCLCAHTIPFFMFSSLFGKVGSRALILTDPFSFSGEWVLRCGFSWIGIFAVGYSLSVILTEDSYSFFFLHLKNGNFKFTLLNRLLCYLELYK